MCGCVRGGLCTWLNFTFTLFINITQYVFDCFVVNYYFFLSYVPLNKFLINDALYNIHDICVI